MRNEPLDFIGVDYAVDNRDVEETILPLAAGARRSACWCTSPFGRTRLFRRVGDRPVPDGRRSSTPQPGRSSSSSTSSAHPAVTVVTPATSQAENMIDNIGGGLRPNCRMPRLQQRMAEFIDALPEA